MFDIGWSELVVVGVVALVVIGPKELPGVLRTVGKSVNKLRQMAGDFRNQFDDAMREAELHEVKKDFTDMTSAASSAMAATGDPLSTFRDEVKSSVEGVKDAPASAAKAETKAEVSTPASVAAGPAPRKKTARAKPAAPVVKPAAPVVKPAAPVVKPAAPVTKPAASKPAVPKPVASKPAVTKTAAPKPRAPRGKPGETA